MDQHPSFSDKIATERSVVRGEDRDMALDVQSTDVAVGEQDER